MANPSVSFLSVIVEPEYPWQVLDDEPIHAPCKLGQIFKFSKLVAKAKSDEKLIVICAGRNPEILTSCAALIGSYMILCESCSVQEVLNIFDDMSALLATPNRMQATSSICRFEIVGKRSITREVSDGSTSSTKIPIRERPLIWTNTFITTTQRTDTFTFWFRLGCWCRVVLLMFLQIH